MDIMKSETLFSKQNKTLQYKEEGKLESTWKHIDSTAAKHGDTELNDHQIQHAMTFLLSSSIMQKPPFSKDPYIVLRHQTM